MALEQKVLMKNVWQKVGKKLASYKFTGSLQPALVQAREYGLLLHWPKSVTFLNLEARPGDRTAFGRGSQALRTVVNEVAAQGLNLSFLDGRHVLVARVLRGDPIVVTFIVNTDDPEFCHQAERARHEAERARKELPASDQDVKVEVKVEVEVMAFAGGDTEAGHIHLFLSPATEVGRYEGYVALDVGNTASTLVCLPRSNAGPRTSAIQVLDANEERSGSLKSNPEPVISHVRIDTITDVSEKPHSVKWVVGRVASTAIDGLVVGPKRLAAAQDWEVEEVFNWRQGIALPRRVPAELLVCRLLQRFREATSSHPSELALTYPTTYEPRELNQLREVVWRGDRRAAWCSQARARDEEWVKKRVPVLLDEASAAAYFYLYQRVLETPGGLPRFRYLYPEGFNLLLYDCGGGTTDMALVNARSEPGSNKLVISVQARSGLRGFGGDNITVAVFRLLKAKLGREIDRLEGKRKLAPDALPDKPVSGKDLQGCLRKGAEVFDQFVPTLFDPSILDDVNRQRRNFALELWKQAESLKWKLKKGESFATLGVLSSGAGKGQLGLWDTLLERFSASPGRQKEARDKLQQIKIHRWEVDGLIREDLEKSIDNCNQLIRKKLTDHGEEVHWVVASGNGVRYPLIQELLREHLDVQALDDERFTLDDENLKHAVAKGAVLYLATLRAERQLAVEFDTVLSECLPFDVASRDPVTNTYSVLFREQERYDRIMERRERLDSLDSAAEGSSRQLPGHWIALARRWPGDRDYSPYLRFKFDQDVQFPVEVRFDPETKQFEVTDARGETGKIHEEVDPRIYESPVQRGDL